MNNYHLRAVQLNSANRRGAAAGELAIVLPFVAIVVFGCIDFGQFGSVWVALTNAVRAGAEYGANHKMTPATQSQWESDIHAATNEEMAGTPGFDSEALQISVEVSVESDGTQRVSVSASYEFKPVIGSYGLPEVVQLNQHSTMRLLL